MKDFKTKRIEYVNNWPNSILFKWEQEYEERVKLLAKNTSFIPMKMDVLDNEYYNRAISFLIDAIEVIDRRPQHSFSYIFTAYDLYSKSVCNKNITDRNVELIYTVFKDVITNNIELNNAFVECFKEIPQKTLQYLFGNLYNEQIRKRTIKDDQCRDDVSRTLLIDSITNKYSNDFTNYSTGIRPGSRLLYHIFNKDTVNIDGQDFKISIEDRLSLLLSGYIYSLRNDNEHGSTISATKSSMTRMSTFANSYFAFFMTYYFLLIVIFENTKVDKKKAYIELADNMKSNLDLYKKIFGHSIKE
mgnify:CR=1 FL=1